MYIQYKKREDEESVLLPPHISHSKPSAGSAPMQHTINSDFTVVGVGCVGEMSSLASQIQLAPVYMDHL